MWARTFYSLNTTVWRLSAQDMVDLYMCVRTAHAHTYVYICRRIYVCVWVWGYLIPTKCSGPPEVFTGFRAFTYAAGPCPAEYAMSSPPNSPPQLSYMLLHLLSLTGSYIRWNSQLRIGTQAYTCVYTLHVDYLFIVSTSCDTPPCALNCTRLWGAFTIC